MRLRIFHPLIEVELDLTDRLQSRDEVVVEDTEVGERLRLSVAIRFLNTRSVRPESMIVCQSGPTGVLSTPKILSMYW